MPGTVPVILCAGRAPLETCQASCRSFCVRARRPWKHAGHRAGLFVCRPGALGSMPGTMPVILCAGQAPSEACQALCRSFCVQAGRPQKHARHRAGQFLRRPGALGSMPGTVPVIFCAGRASSETCRAPCRSFCIQARRPPKHARHHALLPRKMPTSMLSSPKSVPVTVPVKFKISQARYQDPW